MDLSINNTTCGSLLSLKKTVLCLAISLETFKIKIRASESYTYTTKIQFKHKSCGQSEQGELMCNGIDIILASYITDLERFVHVPKTIFQDQNT